MLSSAINSAVAGMQLAQSRLQAASQPQTPKVEQPDFRMNKPPAGIDLTRSTVERGLEALIYTANVKVVQSFERLGGTWHI